MLKHLRLILLSVLLLPAGCESIPTGPGAPPAPKGAPEAQPGRASDPQGAAEEAAVQGLLQQLKAKSVDYKITPADLLQISVYRESDMDKLVRVSQNGTISFPLVGTLKVGGLSQGESEALLAEKLKEFLVDPQVTIFIKEYGNKKVFVLGDVMKPGSYDLPPESKLTVLEAISLAGGFTPVAGKDRTKVIRTTPEGKNVSFLIEVSAITMKGEKQKDIPLEPNDVVFVPQSFF